MPEFHPISHQWLTRTPEAAKKAAAKLGWIQEPPITVHLKLEELMSERGLRQVDCARILGIFPQTFNRMETGRDDGYFKTVHISGLSRLLKLTLQEELGLMHLSGCLTRMDSKIDLRAKAA